MVGRRNTFLVTKKSLRNADSASGKRPKRVIQAKHMEETVGMSRQEEQELNKALYASLQENRRSKSMPGLFAHDSNSSSSNSSNNISSPRRSLPGSSKHGKFGFIQSRPIRPGVTSPSRSSHRNNLNLSPKRVKALSSPRPKSSLPSSVCMDESSQDSVRSSCSSGNGSKKKIHAQRKFAQGCALPGTPSSTPAKLANPPVKKLSSRMPKTEDFLTFLCLRGTSLLPPHLECFNYSREELPAREEGSRSGGKVKRQREGTPDSSSTSSEANEEVAEAAVASRTPIQTPAGAAVSAAGNGGGSSLMARHSARASAGTPETARGIVSLRQGLKRKVASTSSSLRSSSHSFPLVPPSSHTSTSSLPSSSTSSWLQRGQQQAWSPASSSDVSYASSTASIKSLQRPKFYFMPEKSVSPAKESGIRPGEFTPPSYSSRLMYYKGSPYYGTVHKFSPLVFRPSSKYLSPKMSQCLEGDRDGSNLPSSSSSSSSSYPYSSRSSSTLSTTPSTPRRHRRQGTLSREDAREVIPMCSSFSYQYQPSPCFSVSNPSASSAWSTSLSHNTSSSLPSPSSFTCHAQSSSVAPFFHSRPLLTQQSATKHLTTSSSHHPLLHEPVQQCCASHASESLKVPHHFSCPAANNRGSFCHTRQYMETMQPCTDTENISGHYSSEQNVGYPCSKRRYRHWALPTPNDQNRNIKINSEWECGGMNSGIHSCNAATQTAAGFTNCLKARHSCHTFGFTANPCASTGCITNNVTSCDLAYTPSVSNNSSLHDQHSPSLACNHRVPNLHASCDSGLSDCVSNKDIPQVCDTEQLRSYDKCTESQLDSGFINASNNSDLGVIPKRGACHNVSCMHESCLFSGSETCQSTGQTCRGKNPTTGEKEPALGQENSIKSSQQPPEASKTPVADCTANHSGSGQQDSNGSAQQDHVKDKKREAEITGVKEAVNTGLCDLDSIVQLGESYDCTITDHGDLTGLKLKLSSKKHKRHKKKYKDDGVIKFKKKSRRNSGKRMKIRKAELTIPKLTIRFSKKHMLWTSTNVEDVVSSDATEQGNHDKSNFQQEFMKMLEATNPPQTPLDGSSPALLDYHGCVSESELFVDGSASPDQQADLWQQMQSNKHRNCFGNSDRIPEGKICSDFSSVEESKSVGAEYEPFADFHNTVDSKARFKEYRSQVEKDIQRTNEIHEDMFASSNSMNKESLWKTNDKILGNSVAEIPKQDKIETFDSYFSDSPIMQDIDLRGINHREDTESHDYGSGTDLVGSSSPKDVLVEDLTAEDQCYEADFPDIDLNCVTDFSDVEQGSFIEFADTEYDSYTDLTYNEHEIDVGTNSNTFEDDDEGLYVPDTVDSPESKFQDFGSYSNIFEKSGEQLPIPLGRAEENDIDDEKAYSNEGHWQDSISEICLQNLVSKLRRRFALQTRAKNLHRLAQKTKRKYLRKCPRTRFVKHGNESLRLRNSPISKHKMKSLKSGQSKQVGDVETFSQQKFSSQVNQSQPCCNLPQRNSGEISDLEKTSSFEKGKSYLIDQILDWASAALYKLSKDCPDICKKETEERDCSDTNMKEVGRECGPNSCKRSPERGDISEEETDEIVCSDTSRKMRGRKGGFVSCKKVKDRRHHLDMCEMGEEKSHCSGTCKKEARSRNCPNSHEKEKEIPCPYISEVESDNCFDPCKKKAKIKGCSEQCRNGMERSGCSDKCTKDTKRRDCNGIFERGLERRDNFGDCGRRGQIEHSKRPQERDCVAKHKNSSQERNDKKWSQERDSIAHRKNRLERSDCIAYDKDLSERSYCIIHHKRSDCIAHDKNVSERIEHYKNRGREIDYTAHHKNGPERSGQIECIKDGSERRNCIANDEIGSERSDCNAHHKNRLEGRDGIDHSKNWSQESDCIAHHKDCIGYCKKGGQGRDCVAYHKDWTGRRDSIEHTKNVSKKRGCIEHSKNEAEKKNWAEHCKEWEHERGFIEHHKSEAESSGSIEHCKSVTERTDCPEIYKKKLGWKVCIDNSTDEAGRRNSFHLWKKAEDRRDSFGINERVVEKRSFDEHSKNAADRRQFEDTKKEHYQRVGSSKTHPENDNRGETRCKSKAKNRRATYMVSPGHTNHKNSGEAHISRPHDWQPVCDTSKPRHRSADLSNCSSIDADKSPDMWTEDEIPSVSEKSKLRHNSEGGSYCRHCKMRQRESRTSSGLSKAVKVEIPEDNSATNGQMLSDERALSLWQSSSQYNTKTSFDSRKLECKERDTKTAYKSCQDESETCHEKLRKKLNQRNHGPNARSLVHQDDPENSHDILESKQKKIDARNSCLVHLHQCNNSKEMLTNELNQRKHPAKARCVVHQDAISGDGELDFERTNLVKEKCEDHDERKCMSNIVDTDCESVIVVSESSEDDDVFYIDKPDTLTGQKRCSNEISRKCHDRDHKWDAPTSPTLSNVVRNRNQGNKEMSCFPRVGKSRCTHKPVREGSCQNFPEQSKKSAQLEKNEKDWKTSKTGRDTCIHSSRLVYNDKDIDLCWHGKSRNIEVPKEASSLKVDRSIKQTIDRGEPGLVGENNEKVGNDFECKTCPHLPRSDTPDLRDKLQVKALPNKKMFFQYCESENTKAFVHKSRNFNLIGVGRAPTGETKAVGFQQSMVVKENYESGPSSKRSFSEAMLCNKPRIYRGEHARSEMSQASNCSADQYYESLDESDNDDLSIVTSKASCDLKDHVARSNNEQAYQNGREMDQNCINIEEKKSYLLYADQENMSKSQEKVTDVVLDLSSPKSEIGSEFVLKEQSVETDQCEVITFPNEHMKTVRGAESSDDDVVYCGHADENPTKVIALHSFGSLNTGHGFALVNGKLEKCKILDTSKISSGDSNDQMGKGVGEDFSELKADSVLSARTRPMLSTKRSPPLLGHSRLQLQRSIYLQAKDHQGYDTRRQTKSFSGSDSSTDNGIKFFQRSASQSYY